MSSYDKIYTVPVMADAGSATLLVADNSDTEWKFTFYTDGTGRDSLMIPAGAHLLPFKQKILYIRNFSDGGKKA